MVRELTINGDDFTTDAAPETVRYRVEFSEGVTGGSSLEDNDIEVSETEVSGVIGNGLDILQGEGTITVEHSGAFEDFELMDFRASVDDGGQAVLSPGESVTFPAASVFQPELQRPDNPEICTTIPLSWANNIPGVSGIEDVQICIPTPEEIAYQVGQFFLNSLGLFDGIETIVTNAVDDLDAPEFEVDPGLFGDTIDNLEEAIQEIVDENLPELPELEDTVNEIQQEIDDSLPDLQEIQDGVRTEIDEALDEQDLSFEDVDIPTVDEIQQGVAQAVEDVLTDLPGSQLLTDPETFIDEQIQRTTDGLVDDDVLADLEDILEDDN